MPFTGKQVHKVRKPIRKSGESYGDFQKRMKFYEKKKRAEAYGGKAPAAPKKKTAKPKSKKSYMKQARTLEKKQKKSQKKQYSAARKVKY